MHKTNKRHSVDMKFVDMVSKKISEYHAVNHRLLILIGLALSSKCQSDAVRTKLEEIFKDIELLTPKFERFITESYQEIKKSLALLDSKKEQCQ
jgi:endonuclease III